MKKQVGIGLCLVMSMSCFLSTSVFAQESITKKPQIKINKMIDHDHFNVPQYMSGDLTLPSKDNAALIVKNFIKSKNKKIDYKTTKKFKNKQMQTVFKTQQMYNGLKVKDAQQSYILNEDGVIQVVSGINIPDVEKKIQGSFSLDKNSVLEIVSKDLNRDLTATESLSVEKIVCPVEDQMVYAYDINVSYTSPYLESWNYIVDASNGEIIEKNNDLVFESVAVDGKGSLGASRSMTGYKGTIPDLNIVPQYDYSLVDTTKQAPEGFAPRSIKIMTNELTSALTDNTKGDKILASDQDGHFIEDSSKFHAVDAHFFASKVYDFYKDRFGRYSFDNNGSDIIVNTHATFGETEDSNGNIVANKNNAAWVNSTKQIYIGDGDGVQMYGLSGEAETMGHEFTHGVLSTDVSLPYVGESGAIEESLADLFGEAFEGYCYSRNPDWLKSVEADLSGKYTLDFKNPQLKKIKDSDRSYPTHIEEMFKGTFDYRGVHINAAILTKAYSLMSDGGVFRDVNVPAIGLNKVTDMMYKVITEYLTPTSDFKSFSESVLDAAKSMYGENSTEMISAKSAFQAVGIINNTNSWKTISKSPFIMPSGTFASSQVNDKVYVMGGRNYFYMGDEINDVHEYNIATNTWTQKGDMPKNRSDAIATTVNGKIYTLFGNESASISSTSIDVYNPTNDTWEKETDLPQKNIIPNSTYTSGKELKKTLSFTDTTLELKTGQIPEGASIDIIVQLSFDNINYEDFKEHLIYKQSNTSSVFNWFKFPKDYKYARIVIKVNGGDCQFEINASNFRRRSSAISYNGKIYILGGQSWCNTNLNTMDVYDTVSKQWVADLEGLTVNTIKPTLVLVPINNQPKIYAFGRSTVEVYDLNSGTWNHAAFNVPKDYKLNSASAVVINNKIYINCDSSTYYAGSMVIFDPVTGEWHKELNNGHYSIDNPLSFLYQNNLYHLSAVSDEREGLIVDKYEPMKITAFLNDNAISLQWSKFKNNTSSLTIDDSVVYTGQNGYYRYSPFNTSKQHQMKVTQNDWLLGNITSKNLQTVYQKIGDLDGDDSITSSDAALLKNSLLEIQTLNSLQKVAADINRDGTVNVADFTILSGYTSLGKPNPTIGTLEFMIYGDINGDGTIDMDDYNLIYNTLLNDTPLSYIQFVVADVTGDGQLDISDSQYIKRYLGQDNIIFPVINR